MVRSPPPPRKSVFIRLNYPKNYEANYLGQAATPKSASLVLPLPKSSAQRSTLEPPHILDFKKPCVLRWVRKSGVKTSAFSLVGSNQGGLNSNSLAHLEAPTPFNVKGSNSNLKIDAFPGPTSSPSFSAHCSRCLGPGHTWQDCKGSIRCKSCFNYGHLSFACHSKGRQRVYRPISKSEGGRPPPSPLNAVASSSSAHSEKLSTSPSLATVKTPSSVMTMANFSCDPRPFVRPGFTLEPPLMRPLLRHEVFVTGCYTHSTRTWPSPS